MNNRNKNDRNNQRQKPFTQYNPQINAMQSVNDDNNNNSNNNKNKNYRTKYNRNAHEKLMAFQSVINDPSGNYDPSTVTEINSLINEAEDMMDQKDENQSPRQW